MEIITDTFTNISLNQLNIKLSEKYAKLEKIEETEKLNSIKKTDYIEQSTSIKNYDQEDFERVLSKFKKSDSDIRTHEQIHATIGHTTAPISYSYQKGPDGKMYAVGGAVRLDTSIPDDPKAAQFKLDQLKRASNGPSDLSSSDITISTQANLNKMIISMQGDKNENK